MMAAESIQLSKYQHVLNQPRLTSPCVGDATCYDLPTQVALWPVSLRGIANALVRFLFFIRKAPLKMIITNWELKATEQSYLQHF